MPLARKISIPVPMAKLTALNLPHFLHSPRSFCVSPPCVPRLRLLFLVNSNPPKKRGSVPFYLGLHGVISRVRTLLVTGRLAFIPSFFFPYSSVFSLISCLASPNFFLCRPFFMHCADPVFFFSRFLLPPPGMNFGFYLRAHCAQLFTSPGSDSPLIASLVLSFVLGHGAAGLLRFFFVVSS